MNWEMREGSALVTELPLGLVVVLEALPSLAVVVSTLVPSFLVSV